MRVGKRGLRSEDCIKLFPSTTADCFLDMKPGIDSLKLIRAALNLAILTRKLNFHLQASDLNQHVTEAFGAVSFTSRIERRNDGDFFC
jgi:hypothetical protein